ncbi:hypothetical protein [Clostridium sp. UBA6640]|nr:hypothetical protein [Clostridium sp. UBA6640]
MIGANGPLVGYAGRLEINYENNIIRTRKKV